MPALLAAFDAPAPFSTKGKRDVTNVPAQSLALMNDPFVHELAKSWMEEMLRQTKDMPDSKRIDFVFERALGRPPSNDERSQALKYIDSTLTANRTAIRSLRNLELRMIQLEKERKAFVEPIKKVILQARIRQGQDVKPVGPEPLMHWTFETGFREELLSVDTKPVGNARIKDGKLILDGKSFVATEPITKDIAEKTLEVWVTLDNLNQRGGGAISIQTLDGNTFDSIVFGERQPGEWMAGSNFFARTQDVGGPKEVQATDDPVHVAVVYSKDGTITCYRNGLAYGKPYRKSGLQKYTAGKFQILFGMRHGTRQKQTSRLAGSIHEAKFYDRALSASEIKASALGDPNFVSQKQLVAQMSKEQQSRWKEMNAAINSTRARLDETQHSVRVEANAHWHELGKAVFNLKEFIYLR